MSKLSREEIFETADLLYFGFMEVLCDSDRDKFIIDDEETRDIDGKGNVLYHGTKNTEKGQELFNTIEFYLESIKWPW